MSFSDDLDARRTGCLIVPVAALAAFVIVASVAAGLGTGAGWSAVAGVAGALIGGGFAAWGLGRGAFTGNNGH